MSASPVPIPGESRLSLARSRASPSRQPQPLAPTPSSLPPVSLWAQGVAALAEGAWHDGWVGLEAGAGDWIFQEKEVTLQSHSGETLGVSEFLQES